MTREEAEANLEAAIADYSRAVDPDAPGDVLTGWALVASFTSATLMEDASTSYMRATPDGQPWHVTLGLVTYYGAMLNRSVLVDEDD
jgi:hypothetical protein